MKNEIKKIYRQDRTQTNRRQTNHRLLKHDYTRMCGGGEGGGQIWRGEHEAKVTIMMTAPNGRNKPNQRNAGTPKRCVTKEGKGKTPFQPPSSQHSYNYY